MGCVIIQLSLATHSNYIKIDSIGYINSNSKRQYTDLYILYSKYSNNSRMATSSKRKDEAIKTYVRIKPLQNYQETFLTNVTKNSIIIKSEQFSYDRVFDGNSTNKDIFEQIGQPLINHSLQGYNACVMAYGQTASGKTFTMKGNQTYPGLIPMGLQRLFNTIDQKGLTAEIRISYIEIYNENIIDLLSSVQNYLEIREDQRKNITITGVTQEKVNKVEQAMKLFQQGESRRKFASNSLNIASSRSHAIFRINIQTVYQNLSKTTSCINMVDLAGSEGISRTKAQGNTKKQGENINKSILALSNVIRGMSQKWQYVNFRDSKLTRILQSSLLNNSRSIVICTINPIIQNYQQTINTLKFGMYASEIRLQVKKNANSINQRYQQSEAKSVHSEGGLQPQQRVQYQQNKRAISQLRQQNQQLRDYKRILNEKIEFLELQNHRLLKNLESSQHALKINKAHSLSFGEFSNEEKEQYQKKIKDLNEQMEVMADKYEALNEYSGKLQKNQRYLIDRIAKYQSEIALLKQTIQNNNSKITSKKVNTPVKPKNIFKPINEGQQICPLTIGSIIVLKSQIIELKQTICRLNEEIAEIVEQRNDFRTQLQLLKDRSQQQRTQYQDQGFSDVHKKQIKNLHLRIKTLKNQVQAGKNREKKLARLVKSCSQIWIQEFDQFNEWYAQNKKRIDSIKKLKTGIEQPRRSSYNKQNNNKQQQ